MLREYGANAFYGTFIVLFFFIGPFFYGDSIGLQIAMMGVGCDFAAVMLAARRDRAGTQRSNILLGMIGTALLTGGLALHVYSN